MLLGALALTGCAQITQYQQAVKTPAPASLQGYWQTTGPQRGLISDRALGSLIITAQGDTLDCRQWQRVIAKPGKLTLLDGQYVNVNKQLRVMPLELDGDELHYDKLTLKKWISLRWNASRRWNKCVRSRRRRLSRISSRKICARFSLSNRRPRRSSKFTS